MAPQGFEDKVAFVWRIADRLRGTFKQHEYGSVMLPLLVLRRMDAALADTKDAVVAQAKGWDTIGPGQDKLLKRTAGRPFYNTSPLSFTTLLNDAPNLRHNLAAYIRALSPEAARVIEAYNFDPKIERMDKDDILYGVVADFADLDVRTSVVSNEAMGYIFEELLRKFSEMSNETAGEHYTPREVIRLMVELLLTGRTHTELMENPKPVRTVYDPAAGTGGMLVGAMDRIRDLNGNAVVTVSGQELNDETWAIAQSDLMMLDIPPEQMRNGNSLTQDAFEGQQFDFMLANPPYGVDWKKYAAPIKDEAERLGMDGRFGAGTPRVSDGSFLFLQHMISKMKTSGSRIGIVLSGSPLFSGQAGSGESEIRGWILAKDWLEGIVALPDQMFYNTGISTYIWILTNNKDEASRGKVRLIDAREMGTKMRKSLGDKRKEIKDDAIDQIANLYGGALDEFSDDSRVRVMDRNAFGYQRITVERPMRRRWEVTPELAEAHEGIEGLVGRRFDTEKALSNELTDLDPKDRKAVLKGAAISDDEAPVIMKKGEPAPDPDLRDQENIPLPEGWMDLPQHQRYSTLDADAEKHLHDEIHPYVPDAWLDYSKTKVGYEIPFTRQFYVYEPPRPVEEIAAEIRDLEEQIQGWMKGLGL
ncbi:N-6 DNA methylase [Kytococcus sedentarius]|uniref:type I restriction-modification system subunit M n=1 Tax=Kytococcus sedentarius TaxID=1276 RepID=UPI0035BBCA84